MSVTWKKQQTETSFNESSNDDILEEMKDEIMTPPSKLTGISSTSGGGLHAEQRKLMVPPHRMTPLKSKWMDVVNPIVHHMKLQIRMNKARRCVELRHTPESREISNSLQKGGDFVKAFLLGFDISDAIALLRIDDLFLQSFEIRDVKRLNGQHLGRCIGRIAGKDGKTKYAIENATRTRIVLADDKIHMLGSFANIKLAKESICSLILGKPAGKVYQHLRVVSRRLKEGV